MDKLFTNAYVEDIEEEGAKKKIFIASDEVEDRQGEVISVDGWKLDNFKKNPVLLWAHDQAYPAIGKAKKIGYKTINGVKKLVFEPVFHAKDELSKLVNDLVEEGWLKASSVGFMPIEQQDNRYTKQELLEISFVNVPANPNALGLAMAKGYSDATIKAVMPDADIVMDVKPYPNEHACRLKNPDDFQPNTFRRTTRDSDGKKYSIIMGKLKGETSMTEQAYRYDKDVWSAGEARTHCKDHDGSFEAASEEAEYRLALEKKIGDLAKEVAQLNEKLRGYETQISQPPKTDGFGREPKAALKQKQRALAIKILNRAIEAFNRIERS